eukprot:gb/GFBE01038026.1/.p1 GENE.gb/GFBE01038026.1/~~gb/GFBE01038026.1/.p1  ORF type:complete len:736 (+),score=133.32 gb/GFBE01038026.1/:1-2208(+)
MVDLPVPHEHRIRQTQEIQSWQTSLRPSQMRPLEQVNLGRLLEQDRQLDSQRSQIEHQQRELERLRHEIELQRFHLQEFIGQAMGRGDGAIAQPQALSGTQDLESVSPQSPTPHPQPKLSYSLENLSPLQTPSLMYNSTRSLARSVREKALTNVSFNPEIDEEVVIEAMSSVSATARGEDSLPYELQKSVWDAAMLIGLPGTGLSRSDAALTVCALLLNVTLQLGFCLFVHVGFNSEFSDPAMASQGLLRWRTHYGHHWSLAQKETGRSLVSLVCSSDQSVASSARQSLLVDSLFEYLGSAATTGNPFFAPGFVLILFALACWVLSILAELRSVMHFALAVGTMKSAKSGVSRGLSHSPSGKLSLENSMSNAQRLTLLGLIVFSRAAVAALLFHFGSHFLSYTIELSEVMLNAVALLFILEIDELMYRTLLTHNVHKVLTMMKPLRVSPPVWRAWHRLEGGTLFVMFCSLFAIVVCTGAMPMFRSVSTVYQTLCGGDVDFVYSQDSISLWPAFTTSPIFNDLTKYPAELLTDNVTKLVEARAMSATGRLPTTLSGNRVFIKEGALSVVESWGRTTGQQWSSQRSCSNSDEEMRDVVLLRASFKEQIRGCDDLIVEHCTRTPPRLFCPLFCHCQAMSNFTPPADWSGDTQNFLADHRNDGNTTRKQQRCCHQLSVDGIKEQCLQATSEQASSMNQGDFDALLRPLGNETLKWWRTCVSGFASCPEKCADSKASDGL